MVPLSVFKLSIPEFIVSFASVHWVTTLASLYVSSPQLLFPLYFTSAIFASTLSLSSSADVRLLADVLSEDNLVGLLLSQPPIFSFILPDTSAIMTRSTFGFADVLLTAPFTSSLRVYVPSSFFLMVFV